MTEETPRTGTGAPPAEGPKKISTTVTAGTLIMGTYEIEKIINSGGMGEVYRGRNIHNDEPVAIKIVLPSLAHDAKIVALFQKESTVLSRLSHEAIVRYHVFTNDPTIGRPCMVMEFVSGTALADRIEEGPMPLEDVKTMLRRVASGLDKAHKAGVVHRDLSPDNVILEEGSVAHAKLIDFGIAKSTNIGAGTLLQGQFAGKFNWVSPEQLGAFGGHVDGRSDIYSLALITAGVSRGKVLEMGASIVDAVGKRASVPDLTGVDPALVPLLSWMLQPDPGQRTESMAKVMAALDDPSLVPQAKAPEPPAPDPNRTVIEPLPVQPSAPPAAAVSEPPAPLSPLPGGSQPPAASPPPATAGWDMPSAPPATAATGLPRTAPPPVTSAPVGATVIEPHGLRGTIPPAPEPEVEAEDASPFGAPGASYKPAAAAAPAASSAPAAKKGKGGMIAVLALLVAAGGGAGAYYGGLLDPKPPAAPDSKPETTATETTTPPAEDAAAADKAAAEQAAAEKAAADQAAAEQAAADKAAAEKAAADQAEADRVAAEKAAAEKAAADQAAAEKAAAEKAAADAALSEQERLAKLEAEAAAAATEAKSQTEAVEAARSMAEGALAEAEKAAADASVEAMDSAGAQALADTAATAAKKAHAAADAAMAGLAVTSSAVETAKRAAEPVKGLDDLRAKADGDAGAAAAAAEAADKTVAAITETVKAKADAEAAKLAAAQAAEQAAADALKADPVARQKAFFAAYTAPACTAVRLVEEKPEGFALAGFGVDTKALEELDAAWKTETKTKPDIAVRLVNEPQCSVLDFATRHATAEPLTVRMTGSGETVQSGKTIEGVIEGLNGRPFVLLHISASGGASNLKDWVTPGEDGAMNFRFSLKLAKGPSRAPQMLVVLIGGEALPKALEKLKPGSNAQGLFTYLDKQIEASGEAPALGLGFFQLEE